MFKGCVVTIQLECPCINVGLCCQLLYSMVYNLFCHSCNLNVTLFTINLQHNIFLNCNEPDHAIANMNELPMFPYILWMSCLCQDTSCQRLYPVEEQQFQTLSCVHCTIFSEVKLDLCIRILLQDHILARKKIHVRFAYILLKVSTLLQPRSSSVNSSFHRRSPTTVNAFSEYLFDFFDVALQVSSLYLMSGLTYIFFTQR